MAFYYGPPSLLGAKVYLRGRDVVAWPKEGTRRESWDRPELYYSKTERACHHLTAVPSRATKYGWPDRLARLPLIWAGAGAKLLAWEEADYAHSVEQKPPLLRALFLDAPSTRG